MSTHINWDRHTNTFIRMASHINFQSRYMKQKNWREKCKYKTKTWWKNNKKKLMYKYTDKCIQRTKQWRVISHNSLWAHFYGRQRAGKFKIAIPLLRLINDWAKTFKKQEELTKEPEYNKSFVPSFVRCQQFIFCLFLLFTLPRPVKECSVVRLFYFSVQWQHWLCTSQHRRFLKWDRSLGSNCHKTHQDKKSSNKKNTMFSAFAAFNLTNWTFINVI